MSSPDGRPAAPGGEDERSASAAPPEPDIAPAEDEHAGGPTEQTPPVHAGVGAAGASGSGPGANEGDASAAPEPAPVEARSAAEPDPCARASRGDRESCYRDAAASASLRAQNAQFRLGELQLARGAAAEALETWREYRRRYPGGLYVEEADLGNLEARLRLGSVDVLRATDEFLARHGASARAAEVRAIKGVLLHGLGRCPEALSEYERAMSGTLSARRRTDAEYGTAACLESLGRTPEAIAAYRRLLERHPSGRTSGRAREALRRLQRADGGAR